MPCRVLLAPSHLAHVRQIARRDVPVSVTSEACTDDTPSVHVQLKEMIADAVDKDRRLTETELFTQQMQKVCDFSDHARHSSE